MTPTRFLLVAILALLMVGGAFYLRATWFEKIPVEIEKGLSGEAATNPYFALRELCLGMGAEARTVHGLRTLPPSDHALWLALEGRPLLQDESRRLLDWVHGGGHLLIDGQSPIADPFLAATGIGLFNQDQADDDDHLVRSRFDTDRPAWPMLYSDGDSPPRRADGETDAAWALTAEHGAGAITVLADAGFATNLELGEKQHAELAWWLVSLESRAPGIFIVHRNPPPSVWSLLSSRARPLVLALSMLCLVALARFARPFGPRLPPVPRDRRHLSEHLRATGRFLWDREVEHVLLEAEQSTLGEQLARGREMTPAQLAEVAAEVAGNSAPTLDAASFEPALTLASTRDRQQFTDTIHVLEKLRRIS